MRSTTWLPAWNLGQRAGRSFRSGRCIRLDEMESHASPIDGKRFDRGGLLNGFAFPKSEGEKPNIGGPVEAALAGRTLYDPGGSDAKPQDQTVRHVLEAVDLTRRDILDNAIRWKAPGVHAVSEPSP